MTTNSQNFPIVNNFFILTDEQLKTYFDQSAFHPMEFSYSKKSFLTQKRKGPQSKILVINENDFKQLSVEVDKVENDDCDCFATSGDKIDEDNSNEYLLSEPTNNITILIPLEESENENKQLLNPMPQKTNLFEVKTKIKYGRKLKTSMDQGKHTKYSYDNVLRKIKVKFHKKIVNYINSIILSKYRNKTKTLNPLAGEISKDNRIKFNVNLLNSKLKDIFSTSKINGKFRSLDKFYNKNVIDTIYKENIKELIDILEMTYLEVFKIFRDINETQKLPGFEKYDSVIRELQSKKEDAEYIGRISSMIMNFENYYLNKNPRK